MNLQIRHSPTPLRLLVVNPLSAASKLAITEIMLDMVFGCVLIDIILLVYSNELSQAEDLKRELRSCAYSVCNSIQISSNLPSLSDADIFMFISNFPNPNKIDFTQIEKEEYFDTFYLITKIAHTLIPKTPVSQSVETEKETRRKRYVPPKKSYKPIIVADGIVTLHILNTVCKNMPSDIMFCPSPVPVTVRSVLADYLKIEIPKFNHVHAWAADDEVFHFEVVKPIIMSDKSEERGVCGTEPIGAELLESFKLDYLELSDSWLKKECVNKVQSNLERNPYGSIFRASEIVRIIRYIWKSRAAPDLSVYINMGVISDGGLGTIKGLPYVLPLVFFGDDWLVNKRFERNAFLHQEVKRINKRVKEHKEELVPYIKKFLEENIINKQFLQVEEEATTTISVAEESNVIFITD